MTQPNVLMIVVDQWRADVLSKLGTEHIRTPNIDRLCAEGVTFANHVTVTCPCGPARASLMTGLYASNHGVVQNSLPLDRRHATLAGELRKVGYDPALIGYSTSVPDPRGLSTNDPRFRWLGDVMEGFRPIASFEPEKEAYFGWVSRQGFPLPANRDDIWLPEGDATPGPTDRPARIPAPLSDTAFFTEAALTYLEGRTPDRPFFLHLGYWRPHPPFVASAPYNDMYDPADMPGPLRAPSPQEEGAQHPLLAHHLCTNRSGDYFQGAEGLAADLSDDEIRQTRATYYGLITEIDDHLGRIFAQLDRAGIWDDTLIIFTSDHGEQLGDHHLLGKTCYHDQSFRVPLVIKDPRRKSRAGEIETAFTESIDVMPTILDWLGGSLPHTLDGHSLLPFLESGRPEGWREALHYEFDSRDAFGREHEAALGVGQHEAGLCVIQDADWKYVHFTAMPPLLFDLKNDPGQFINLAEDPAHADTLRIYAQKMLSWRMRHADRTLTVFQSNPEGFLDRRSSH